MTFREEGEMMQASDSDASTGSFFIQKSNEIGGLHLGGVSDIADYRIERPPKELLKMAELEKMLGILYNEDPLRIPQVVERIQLGILLGRGDYELPEGEGFVEELTRAYELLGAWRRKARESLGSFALENSDER